MNREHQLKTMPYHEYLQTPEWEEKRQQTLVRDSFTCRVCNSPDSLEVHHRTYRRRGNEKIDDLTTLCETCHIHVHKNIRQVDMMDRTYTPPLPLSFPQNTSLVWERALLSILLITPEVILHIRGILSQEDFQEEETRTLYEYLLQHHLSEPLVLPPHLEDAATRCKQQEYTRTLSPTGSQIRVAVQSATRIKRAHLLRLNQDISTKVASLDRAIGNGDIHNLQQQQLDIMKALRTLNSVISPHK